jgi:RNA polymerase sigma-70 factor, ECF subfamily
MLDDRDIKQLILRTASQDVKAFSSLYEQTSPMLLGIALRITRRRETAEEVLHDAFVKVWNQAKSFDPLALQPVAWLSAIVRNRALDLVTSAEATRVESFDRNSDGDEDGNALERLIDWSDDSDAGDSLDAKRSNHYLKDCLQELKPGERQAIALAYHHGMSHSELAEHLHKPIGTVKSWVRRGLDALRTCMESCAGATR